VLSGHLIRRPGQLVGDGGRRDESEAHPVGVLEGQHRLAEALLGLFVRHALVDEAVGPEADRAFWHAKGRLLRETDTEPSRRDVRPGEERQDCAGAAGLVGVVQVIGAGVVEIDGLFHETKAERASVEVEVASCVAGDRGDVVNAVFRHWQPPLDEPFARC
jgi:hypothetical protein